MDTVELYTDGACFPNPGKGSFAYAIIGPDGVLLREGCGVDPQTTSVRMEYLALIAGIMEIKKEFGHVRRVNAYSDSNLLVQTFNEWIDGWYQKNWKRKLNGKAKNTEIKNLDLVQKLHQLKYSGLEINLQWVKGHAGNDWNEFCDQRCSEVLENVFGELVGFKNAYR